MTGREQAEREQAERFFVGDSRFVLTHPNPILDDGSPTSTGGMTSSIRRCEALVITFKPRRPDRKYERGWCFEGRGASEIV